MLHFAIVGEGYEADDAYLVYGVRDNDEEATEEDVWDKDCKFEHGVGNVDVEEDAEQCIEGEIQDSDLNEVCVKVQLYNNEVESEFLAIMHEVHVFVGKGLLEQNCL